MGNTGRTYAFGGLAGAPDSVKVKIELSESFKTTILVDKNATVGTVVSILEEKRRLPVGEHVLTLRSPSGKLILLAEEDSVAPLCANSLVLVRRKLTEISREEDRGIAKFGRRISISGKGLSQKIKRNFSLKLHFPGKGGEFSSRDELSASEHQELSPILNVPTIDPDLDHGKASKVLGTGTMRSIDIPTCSSLNNGSSIRLPRAFTHCPAYRLSGTRTVGSDVQSVLRSSSITRSRKSRLTGGSSSAESSNIFTDSISLHSCSKAQLSSNATFSISPVVRTLCGAYLQSVISYAPVPKVLFQSFCSITNKGCSKSTSPTYKRSLTEYSLGIGDNQTDSHLNSKVPSNQKGCSRQRYSGFKVLSSTTTLNMGVAQKPPFSAPDESPQGDILVYLFLPASREVVRLYADLSFTAEKLLQVACEKMNIDAECCTLEFLSGDCVGLDEQLEVFGRDVPIPKSLRFNIVQKNKIYKHMLFYKDDRKMLSIVCKDRVPRVSSATQQMLLKIVVDAPNDMRGVDIDYINVLVLTYRAYCSSEEFYDSIFAFVPDIALEKVEEKVEESVKGRDGSTSEHNQEPYNISRDTFEDRGSDTGNNLEDAYVCNKSTTHTEGYGGSSDLGLCGLGRENFSPIESRKSVSQSDASSGIVETSTVISSASHSQKGDPGQTSPDACSSVMRALQFIITDELNPDIRIRVKNILSLMYVWVEHYYPDYELNPDLLKKLCSTMVKLRVYMNGIFESDADRILCMVERKGLLYADMVKNYKYVTRKGKTIYGMIGSLEPEDVARQLCLYNYSIISSIHPIEYLNYLWKKSETQLSPLMNHFVQRFDVESYWSVTEILGAGDVKMRASILGRFIIIAAKCLEVNNFFSTFAIVSGLNSPPITRLKKTWEALPDKIRRLWAKLESFVNPSKNMKNYRLAVGKAVPPILPFLPIYFKDLIFMDDGNPTILENGQLINLEKLVMISDRVNDILFCVAERYLFEPITHIQNFIKKPPLVTDLNKLMAMSHQCEPRNTESNTSPGSVGCV